MNLDKLHEYLGIEAAAEQVSDGKSRVVLDFSGSPVTRSEEAEGAGEAREEARQKRSNVVQPSVLERMQEIQLAQKLGYLICKCTWPPQVMTLSTSDFIYRCPRCSRVRDF